MMPFSTKTGLERVGITGPVLLALDAGLLYKNKKQRGSMGDSPIASPMPKSVPSGERKDQLLRG